MKLLIKTKEMENEFKRLINSYSQFYWASAWAGVNFDCFTDLKRNKDKIKKIVIGTLFDQTHPDFIKEFMKNKNVRFFKQKRGTFHPKIYLFQNNESEREVLIGSMNFTAGGFSENTEILILITNKEDTNRIFDNAKKLIVESWNDAKYFSEKELEEYKIDWKNQQRRLGKYGAGKAGKSINRIEIMNISWQEFVKRVKTERYHDFNGRLDLLERMGELFKKYPHFNAASDDERRKIAGFWERKKNKINWLWFGSMKGAGKFKNKINSNNKNISLALDKIPIGENITKEQYKCFINEYKKATPEASNDWMGTASRLLAMKRPDVFVCFDSKNRKKLCKDFGIKQSDMTYERYWDEIIERIQDSEWWKSPQPKDETEIKIWNGRSAFLDALYYEGK